MNNHRKIGKGQNVLPGLFDVLRGCGIKVEVGVLSLK